MLKRGVRRTTEASHRHVLVTVGLPIAIVDTAKELIRRGQRPSLSRMAQDGLVEVITRLQRRYGPIPPRPRGLRRLPPGSPGGGDVVGDRIKVSLTVSSETMERARDIVAHAKTNSQLKATMTSLVSDGIDAAISKWPLVS